MGHITEILVDCEGMEFQFQIDRDRLLIRMNQEKLFNTVNYDCFSMKRRGTMSFTKLYKSRGHFVNLTPVRVLEILETMPENKATLELKTLATFMRDNKN